jgi:hypothetical protein
MDRLKSENDDASNRGFRVKGMGPSLVTFHQLTQERSRQRQVYTIRPSRRNPNLLRVAKTRQKKLRDPVANLNAARSAQNNRGSAIRI